MRVVLLASAALLFAPLAYAQSTSNTQYDLRGSTSVTNVVVDDAVDVGATAIAGGNAIALVGDGADVSLDSSQHMDGAANATANGTVWNADGVVTIYSAAVGNGATATNVGGNVDVTSAQLSHNDANATTRLRGGAAGDAASSSSASGNVVALSAEAGDIRAILNQESTGSTNASTEADHCCVGGQVVSDAVASANNMTAAGSTTTLLTDTRQSATGAQVTARTDLYAGYASDAVGNSTANANAVTIDNAYGYVNTRTNQESTANVSADAYVTLGGDFIGFASAGAYGVGNSTIVSNVTSDTDLDVTQNNAGDVSANAALSGEGGQQALASSAAYGNVVTGALCAYCGDEGPGLNARNDQTNTGDVNSTATVIAPRAHTVAATASAIGNAATYQVSGPGS